MRWMFSYAAWRYLLTGQTYYKPGRRYYPCEARWGWSRFWCRFKNHPAGVRWHNCGGEEPDMVCRGCGDNLG